ncbi:MAG TPA: fumarylacetoacetate hydrolase family protein [Polyangiaceae bacterium]|nr:fumarylacetoacetate hydrolase family protein [Polyangiaceae bacterium]
MRIARVQIDEFAKPVVALVVDGAYYDVGALEERWNWLDRFGPADFHARVVGARCAGLELLEMRVRAGDRPTEARLLPGEFLPLPPCDTDRATYVQLGPYDDDHPTPRFEHRYARTLVGHDQPAVTSDPHAEAGLAVLLGEDLHRASAREAERAMLGFTLLLDWRGGSSQLGPELVLGVSLRDLSARAVTLDGHAAGNVGASRFHPSEALAFVSQYMPLRAGDVVGLGCLANGRAAPAFSEPVTLSVDRFMTLRGWAVAGPEPIDWRRP